MDGEKKNSLLVVDDEKANLKTLAHILISEYIIYTASSGADAIEKAKEYMPDLILLDILMPDMDGYKVLAALKESVKTRNIPVIFITGLSSVEDEEKGMDMEAADYIHKPFSTKIVKSRVRNQIQIVNQLRVIEQYTQNTHLTLTQTKSAFLAKLSNEIHAPLNSILSISEIQLQKENLSQDTKEAFARIKNSGDLLLGIINDILDTG